MPSKYSIVDFGAMLTMGPRTAAYAQALRSAITPGCTVLDLGAGTGFFSLLACKYGAGKVLAVEPHDAVEVLRCSAQRNGFADRITIFQGLSTELAGEKPADVMIFDLRGALPLFENSIDTIVDARQRLLKPGGRLIPRKDTLSAALVSYPSGRAMRTEPWLQNDYGLDLSTAYAFAANITDKIYLEADALLSQSVTVLDIEYATAASSTFRKTVTLTASHEDTADGMAMWFDCDLAEGIGFSNAPGCPRNIYGQTFFPFETSLRLRQGDSVEIEIRCDRIEDDLVWSWRTLAKLNEGPVQFAQSVFRGEPVSAQTLRRLAPDHVPRSGVLAEVDAKILGMFDAARSLDDIAAQISAAFPAVLPDGRSALRHVSRLAERYRQ